MKNSKYIITVILSFWILMLIFTSNCAVNISNDSYKPTNSGQIHETVVTSETNLPSTQQYAQVESSLFALCFDGIVRYTLENNNFSILTSHETKIYSFFDWNTNGIYYIQTTDKSSNSGTGGQQGPSELFWIKPVTGEIERLTFDDYDDSYLTASPQANVLIYTSHRQESDNYPNIYELIKLDVINKTETILLSGPNRFIPVFSPLGDMVAVLEDNLSKEKKTKLLVFNLYQNNQVQILPDKHILTTGISWSPDQKHIAIGIKENDKFSIAFVNIATREVEKRILIDNEPSNLAWSPDGKVILFETREYANVDNVSIQLNIYEIASEKETQIYFGGISGLPYYHGYHAVWSPDGNSVAFFVDNDEQLRQKLIVKNIKDWHQQSFNMPCSIRDAIWKLLP